MSRTDKDLPLYARAQWWEPDHWKCGRDGRHGTRECDLPTEPSPAGYDHTRKWSTRARWGCRWTPVWDRSNCPSVPKWFVDHVWHNKNRVAERTHGRRAAAEHRATGTVDSELPAGQHRHRAQWLWW